MQTKANKTQATQSQAVANELSQKQGNGEGMQFIDTRPEAVAQRKLQEMANNSAQVKQLRGYQKMADNFVMPQQINQQVVQMAGRNDKMSQDNRARDNRVALLGTARSEYNRIKTNDANQTDKVRRIATFLASNYESIELPKFDIIITDLRGDNVDKVITDHSIP